MKLTVSTLTLCMLFLALPPVGKAQGVDPNDIQSLKVKLAEQQKQIEALRQSLDAQQKLIERLTTPAVKPAQQAAAPAVAPAVAPAQGFTPVGGAVASTTGNLPDMSPVAPSPKYPLPAPQDSGQTSYPTQIQLGNVTIMPVGFMDATAVWRNENAGSGIGSSFGSVPFSNAVPGGKLDEFRFSPQNSRLGFRVDGDWKGYRFIGYNEFDFLGTSASNAIGVTNGAFVPRIRLYWVDVRKGSWEVLGGQSWSMLTPNRKGISALPGDIFYSQVMDVNYVLGYVDPPTGFPFPVARTERRSDVGNLPREPQPVHGRLERWTADYAAHSPQRRGRSPVGQWFDQLSEHSEPHAGYHYQGGVRSDLPSPFRGRGNCTRLQDRQSHHRPADFRADVLESRRRRLHQRQL